MKFPADKEYNRNNVECNIQSNNIQSNNIQSNNIQSIKNN